MCRFFAVLATENLSPREYLLDAPGSLLAKSQASRTHPQEDGWGIGWFEDSRAKVFKSPEPLSKNVPLARRVVTPIQSPTLLGHVREASNPGDLPKSELI